MKASTRRGYDYYLGLFRAWARQEGRSLARASVEASVIDYFDVLLARGRPATECEKTLAALVALSPGLSCLPFQRARRALKGYRKLVPPRSRYPLAESLAAALAVTLCAQNRRDVALLVVTSCYMYLRPGEARSIKVKDLADPSVCMPALNPWPSVILCPFEDLEPSKTLTYDDTISCGHPPWLGRLLVALKKGRPRGALLFGLKAEAVLPAWEAAWKALRLPRIELYQLRHAGASADLLARRRREAEVQARGRWRTAASLRRYAKPGQVQRFLSERDLDIQGYASWSFNNLEQVLDGRVRARPPPAP